MGYIKWRLNLFLIWLVMLVVVATVGMAMYYSSTYESLKSKHAEELARLEQVTNTLFQSKEKLRMTASELNKSTTDVEKISSLYEQLKADNAQLQSSLDRTKLDYEEAKADAKAAREQFTAAKEQADDYKAQVETRDAIIIGLRKDKDELEELADDLAAELCEYDTSYC